MSVYLFLCDVRCMMSLFCALGDNSVAEAAGDFIVLHSSKCVHFLPDAGPIATDEIAPIIAASFGLPFHKVVSQFCL